MQVLSVPSHTSKESLQSMYDVCGSVGVDVLDVFCCDHPDYRRVNALNTRNFLWKRSSDEKKIS
jgi:hypothetical protein